MPGDSSHIRVTNGKHALSVDTLFHCASRLRFQTQESIYIYELSTFAMPLMKITTGSLGREATCLDSASRVPDRSEC
jgi:hypothetical protein